MSLPNLCALDPRNAAPHKAAPTDVLVARDAPIPRLPDRRQLSQDPQEALQQLEEAMLDYADTLVYTEDIAYKVSKDFYALDVTQRSDVLLFRNMLSPLGVLDAFVSLAINPETDEAEVAVTVQRSMEIIGFELASERFTTQVKTTSDLSLAAYAKRMDDPNDFVKVRYKRLVELYYDNLVSRMNGLLRQTERPGARAAFLKRGGMMENYQPVGRNNGLRQNVLGPKADLPGGYRNRIERESGVIKSATENEYEMFTMAALFDTISSALRDALLQFFYKPGNFVAELLKETPMG